MANVINHPDALSVYGTTVYASAARTATPDTQEFELGGDTDEIVVVADLTAYTSTGSLTVKVEGVDRVSGKTWTLLSGTAFSGTGTQVLRVGPSLPVTANVSANDVVPPVIRITATHGNGVSLTYSVGLHCS